MFTLNDDLSIYATRGDIVFFSVSAAEDGVPYQFQLGDVLRIKIFGKKKCENVVLEKDFPVVEVTDSVDIFLSKEDTKIGEVISKPTDYWYEIELNPHTDPKTIIGYNEDGPAVFKLFPEGADINNYQPTEEDIPFIDDELDLTSSRPIQNQAVAKAVLRLEVSITDVSKDLGKLNAALAVERARIDNLAKLTNGSTTGDAELTDIRVDESGITHVNAGTAVRKQIADVKDRAEQNGGVYALPLEYKAGIMYYESNLFKMPIGGISVRVIEDYKTSINGYECELYARAELGTMENGTFVYDEDLTAEYSHASYTNKIHYIPYVNCYCRILVIMMGNTVSQFDASNINAYKYVTDYVKVYTGTPKVTGGLLGASVATLASHATEGYHPDWGFRTLGYKYQAMVSPLPLKYVRSVSCPPNVWLGAKVYKFDPITRTTAWIKTIKGPRVSPCFGAECVINFEEYGDNYFALLTFGRVPLYKEYASVGYNGSITGTDKVTPIGFDVSDLVDSIQVDWLPGAVRSDAWGGSPIVQQNIELLKMNKHKTVPALYVGGDGSAYSYLLGKDDFAGVFYGGSYPGGMFYYNVSPATYYAALLNPNSNAYGEADITESGFRYGIMCSCFAVLAHGHPIPRSTFDMRYNPDIEGFEIKPMNLKADLHKLKPYDIITQSAQHTGHSVLVTGLDNVGDMCTALKIMEAATPATRDNVFFLHNGAPYYKEEAEAWYQEAYDFMAISDPKYDDTIYDKANWVTPYTEPQKVMCNRGYGSIYLEGKTHPLLSIDRAVTEITITKDGENIGTYSVADLKPTLKNGYNVVDIMDLVSAGTICVYNNLNDIAEEFHIINVDDYKVNTSLDNDYLSITVTHPEEVKFIEAGYKCTDANYKGNNAPMFFRPNFVGNTTKIPNRVETDLGEFSLSAHSDYRDYVNVIFKTEYDTNTFGIDAENDKYL